MQSIENATNRGGEERIVNCESTRLYQSDYKSILPGV